MLKNRKKLQQGYIYIDVMVGMIILAIALIAFVGAYQQSTRATAAASADTIATNLAMETIEKLKKYEGKSLTRTSAEWTTDIISPTINNMQYQITTAVIPDEKLTSTQIAANSRIIPVQVTVTWSAGKVTMITYYTQ